MTKTPSPEKRASLPFGSEFSPSQVELRQLLELIELNEGDEKKLQAAILIAYFSEHGGAGADPAKAAKNRNTLAMNSRLGLRAYGIIDQTGHFTDFGRELFQLRSKRRVGCSSAPHHFLLPPSISL